MEYISGGDLMGKIKQKKTFTEEQVAKIIYQVLLAVNYMHKKSLVHRDLKPENMMCIGTDDDLTIKLTDFGFACTFDPKEKLDVSLGTPQYRSPELVESEKYD